MWRWVSREGTNRGAGWVSAPVVPGYQPSPQRTSTARLGAQPRLRPISGCFDDSWSTSTPPSPLLVKPPSHGHNLQLPPAHFLKPEPSCTVAVAAGPFSPPFLNAVYNQIPFFTQILLYFTVNALSRAPAHTASECSDFKTGHKNDYCTVK